MEDVKQLMQRHYLKYASYVILDRAIPNVIDGLKPVQRRILYTLWRMHDSKLHKVANVAGQTMALHPHGDAPIIDALINMANKEYLLDRQGNFGNLLTGDPAAAARYIETRLSELSISALFNPDLTTVVSSYDGRQQEPVSLPAKIPVLLMQGAEGIAVGMATNILPHNFTELLEAEIAILEGREYLLLPDFPTGGIMDATNYDRGFGKVKLRAQMEITDPKTIVIREICFGTTTESVIRSIDEAAKRGKIKIDSIHDYTADTVAIEIKLPRGHYAQDLIDALYVYTDCQVSLSPQMVTIKDNLPWEANVNEILEYHVQMLQGYLQAELEIEKKNLLEKIFNKTLERIFIENRLYKGIEEISEYQKIHQVIEEGLTPFHSQLLRIPTAEDREKLLNIPIRRISRFDLDKNQEEIAAADKELLAVAKHLKDIKKFTIRYIKGLILKYGKDHPRKTRIQAIEQVDLRAIATKNVKIIFDPSSGFIGTKVSATTSENCQILECTNFDKILLLYKEGSCRVINIPEKQYTDHKDGKLVYIGVADKKTVINVAYKDPASHLAFAKRFIVEKFILDKTYRFVEEGMEILFLSTEPAPLVELLFIPKPNQKPSQKTPKIIFDFNSVRVKGQAAKGIKMASKAVKKITQIQKSEKAT